MCLFYCLKVNFGTMSLLELDAVAMHVLSLMGKKGSQRVSNSLQREEFEESASGRRTGSLLSLSCLFLPESN